MVAFLSLTLVFRCKMPKIKGYPTNPITLGDHLRKKRMDLNITQKRVSEILQTTEDTITYWENGRSKPQSSYYKRIFNFLGYFPFDRKKFSFGTEVFYARMISGFTLKELSALTGLSSDGLYYIERGLRNPRPLSIEKLIPFIESQFNLLA